MRIKFGIEPLAFGLGAVLALVGCGGTASPSSSALPVQQVTLLLDFTPSPYEAPVTWGEAQGIFAKEGIKLDIKVAMGSSISVPEVASNQVPFAFGSYDVYVGDYLKGETGSTAVEVYENIPTTGLISGQPITDLHQLVGKPFGDVAGSSGIPILHYVLQKNGIDPASVPIQLLSFSVLYPEFYQHKLFAAEMDEPGDEDALDGAQKAGVPASYTPLTNFGLTGYSAVILASNQTVSSDPGLVKRMATAIYQSEVQAVKSATDQEIVTDFQTLSPTATAATVLPAWHDFKAQVTGFGCFDPAAVSSILQRVSAQQGNTSSNVAAASLFKNSYLPSC